MNNSDLDRFLIKDISRTIGDIWMEPEDWMEAEYQS